MKQYIEIGKIVSVHGIKGEVKVQPWCDTPDFFCQFDNYYSENHEIIDISSSRVSKNMIIAKIRDINTPEQAQKLRNKIIFVNRNDIELEKGCYFIQDLIGLECIDADNLTVYGKIVDVTETGANDVYHIKSTDGKMYYIPAIPDVIDRVELDNGKIFIHPLKGLFDDED